MANRKSRSHPGKGHGMSYADVLAHQRMIKQAAAEAAKDTTVQLKADIHTQRVFYFERGMKTFFRGGESVE